MCPFQCVIGQIRDLAVAPAILDELGSCQPLAISTRPSATRTLLGSTTGRAATTTRSRYTSARSSTLGARCLILDRTPASSTFERHEEPAAIWAELEASDSDDVWLYNAAGLSYNEIGEHELAVAWLGKEIELAMRIDDPEGIIDQLSHRRRKSLEALGRDLDELEERVDPA